MDKNQARQLTRMRRRGRIRAKLSGTAERPRLSVFRSNKGMFLQLIDDAAGKTLASASSVEIKNRDKKTVVSLELGKLIAAKAKEKKIAAVVFDRGGYKFHGRIKFVADGAREGGLEF
jgi:large subunit ribosomal protein L18